VVIVDIITMEAPGGSIEEVWCLKWKSSARVMYSDSEHTALLDAFLVQAGREVYRGD
jgi:hypothetical protein